MASDPEPATVAAAYRAFEALRWPDGEPTCPHCGSVGGSRYLSSRDAAGRRTRSGRVSARRVWRCAPCRRQFSVLSATVFERTRVPLPLWLAALGTVDGIQASSVSIRAVTGVDHETARVMAALITSGLIASGACQADEGSQLQG